MVENVFTNPTTNVSDTIHVYMYYKTTPLSVETTPLYTNVTYLNFDIGSYSFFKSYPSVNIYMYIYLYIMYFIQLHWTDTIGT